MDHISQKKIQMVDLYSQYVNIKEDVDQAIQEVLNNSNFIQGQAVSDFAKELAGFNGANFVIPCANGTDALQIAMMALDLKPGDEIILPAFTYIATVEVAALLGIKVVLVDVNPETFNIEPSEIEKAITSKTKAIVPVHLYGQCSDMEAIMAIAGKHNLYVIEDAAQSIGSVYTFQNGLQKKAGTIGTIGTTSFFPSKNLGCFGDGGAIFTNDGQLAKKIQMISNHGQEKKYYHDIIGVNSRLDTLQAAILSVKLKHLNHYCLERQKVADFYDEQLSGINEISLPFRNNQSSHVFHQYTLKIKDGGRGKLKDYLQEKGIPTMIYYPLPIHFQKAFEYLGYKRTNFPISEKLSEEVLSLPIHTEMDENQLLYIVDHIRRFFKD